jgi:hypothetical protein
MEDYVAKSIALRMLVAADPEKKDVLWERVKAATKRDNVCTKLAETVNEGFPEHAASLDEELRPFWKVRDRLTVFEGVVLYGHRTVIPNEMRKQVLADLHAAHPGISRMLARARQSVYWPGIERAVEHTVKNCDACELHKASAASEPWLESHRPEPTLPGEAIAIDFFHVGINDFLCVADRYSGWIEIFPFQHHGVTAAQMIAKLWRWVGRFGLPTRVSSDGGPQMKSKDFRDWCNTHGVIHDVVSPHHHAGHGAGEAAVKKAKHIILTRKGKGPVEKDDGVIYAFLELNNTPLSDGLSPAQRIFGRPLRTLLPCAPLAMRPTLLEKAKAADVRAKRLRARAREQFNKRTRPLTQLQVGQVVRVQNHRTKKWDLLAQVLEPLPGRRSYVVATECGRLKWRNRRFLRPVDGHTMFNDNPVEVENSRDDNRASGDDDGDASDKTEARTHNDVARPKRRYHKKAYAEATRASDRIKNRQQRSRSSD